MEPITRNNLYKAVFASLAASAFLLLAGCGGSSGSSASLVTFTSGQAASVVIGQSDFVTGTSSSTAANTLSSTFSSVFVGNGELFVPDERNNRTLVFKSGIPTVNGASADYAIGQADLVSGSSGLSASALNHPEQGILYNGKWIQDDYQNNRVLIYNTLPLSGPGTADVVVGQTDMISNTSTACDNIHLSSPESVVVAGGRLIVTDGGNNRILIWNSIPTTNGKAADVVLGATNFTTCSGGGTAANTMSYPAGMWTDGMRLAVDDTGNNRILIWNFIPTTNNKAADVVLGQPDFVSYSANQGGSASATTLSYPYDGIWFNSSQFVATDEGNNRVLIWNSFPTTNDQAADVVLGEPDMTTTTGGTSSTLMNNPNGVFLSGKQLLVSDTSNYRTLVFNGK